jgi:RsiW-degrading membrane proteinase PrsW (M82 family)
MVRDILGLELKNQINTNMLLFLVLLFFVGIAAALAFFFIKNDKGEREPVSALWIALGLGFVGAIGAGVLEKFIIPMSALDPGTSAITMLIAAMGIGIIEESFKFIPLAIFIYPRRYFNEHTDGIIYFALAGLGFGLPENILYSVQFGAKVGIGRLILTPIFHASTTAIVGFYLAQSKVMHSTKVKTGLVLALMMILHGLYDFGISSRNPYLTVVSIVITIMLAVMLFLYYSKATDMDRQLGLSVVGNNTFCRSCGAPNPNHELFCSKCGKRA